MEISMAFLFFKRQFEKNTNGLDKICKNTLNLSR